MSSVSIFLLILWFIVIKGLIITILNLFFLTGNVLEFVGFSDPPLLHLFVTVKTQRGRNSVFNIKNGIS